MSDLVGNPEDRFSHVAAQIIIPETNDSMPHTHALTNNKTRQRRNGHPLYAIQLTKVLKNKFTHCKGTEIQALVQRTDR